MSNLTNNRINTTMTAAQVAAVKTALQTIYTNMPFLLGLTIDERRFLPKINVSNKAFAEDAISAVVNNPGSIPAYLNGAQMQNDMTLFTQLDEFAVLTRQLLEKIEDTQMLAGSEAFVSSLASYKIFASAAEAGIPGADVIYAALKRRFEDQGNFKQPDTPEEGTEV